ncbi:hypothetical protein SFK404_2048 [Shigella flexneri K-404]|nr:hypothetical protein SFK404_2048 [Shigella flexneri K-404]
MVLKKHPFLWCFFNLFGVLIPIDERFKPDFARTLRPGWLTVPAADFDMLLTFKSSMTIIAWFLLTAVVTL